MSKKLLLAIFAFAFLATNTTFALHNSYETEIIGRRDDEQVCHDASLDDECAVFVGLVHENANKRIPFQLDLTRGVWEDYAGTGSDNDDSDEDYTGNMLIMGRSYVNDYEGDENEPSKVFFTQEVIDLLLPVSQTWTDDYYSKYRAPLVREMKRFISYFVRDGEGNYHYKNAKSEKQVQKFLKKYTLLTKKLEKMERPEDMITMKDKDAALYYKVYTYTSVLREYGLVE